MPKRNQKQLGKIRLTFFDTFGHQKDLLNDVFVITIDTYYIYN